MELTISDSILGLLSCFFFYAIQCTKQGAFEILLPGICLQFGSNKFLFLYRFGHFSHQHLLGIVSWILKKPTQEHPAGPDQLLGTSKGHCALPATHFTSGRLGWVSLEIPGLLALSRWPYLSFLWAVLKKSSSWIGVEITPQKREGNELLLSIWGFQLDWLLRVWTKSLLVK